VIERMLLRLARQQRDAKARKMGVTRIKGKGTKPECATMVAPKRIWKLHSGILSSGAGRKPRSQPEKPRILGEKEHEGDWRKALTKHCFWGAG